MLILSIMFVLKDCISSTISMIDYFYVQRNFDTIIHFNDSVI